MEASGMTPEQLRELADSMDNGGGDDAHISLVDDDKPKSPKKVTLTALGVTVKADPGSFDDYDLLEEIANYGESPLSFIPMLKALCGKDYQRVKDELRDQYGHLSMERVGQFLDETQKQLVALKN